MALVPHDYLQTTKQGEIEIKKRMRSLATGWGRVWIQVKATDNHGKKAKAEVKPLTLSNQQSTQRIIHMGMKKDIEQF